VKDYSVHALKILIFLVAILLAFLSRKKERKIGALVYTFADNNSFAHSLARRQTVFEESSSGKRYRLIASTLHSWH
jgi:hypothetical protein